jgi:hypothetical protein
VLEVRLIPFADSLPVPTVMIAATVERRSSRLIINYCITGDLAAIVWPVAIADNALPQRRFGLWEQTCLEFFIGVPGQSNYWEFNLSPNRDWNVYALSDYRCGLADALEFFALPITINQSEQEYNWQVAIDLASIVAVSQPIELSITAVMESQPGGHFSYWAVKHCGDEADFHDRRSFVIKLPPE